MNSTPDPARVARMRRPRGRIAFALPAAAALLAASCITVNIYFPEAAIQDAAERIVDEVRPVLDSAGPPAESTEPTDGSAGAAAEPSARRLTPARIGVAAVAAIGVLVLDAPAAFATPLDEEKTPEKKKPPEKKDEKKDEKEIDIDIDDAVIVRIKAEMKSRFPKLLPFYDKPAIGEKNDGYLEPREDGVELSLKEKRDLRALVAAENKDRKSLYERIAEVNGIDKTLVIRIQQVFARAWIAKARKGWWVQDAEGKWVRKAAEPGRPDERVRRGR